MPTPPTDRPYALTIAGLDPSGGAGLMADVKTFEALHVQGLAVATCLTVQHESELRAVRPVEGALLLEQLALLFERYPIRCCKIGLVPSWSTLERILTALRTWQPELSIVVDPIFRATTGYDFHPTQRPSAAVLDQLQLLTPNEDELRLLAQAEETPTDTALRLSRDHCPVLYKGGHNEAQKGTDVLFIDHQQHPFPPTIPVHYDKHGSGCVLSAAIVAHVVRGASLVEACRAAKDYTARFLNSTPGLLGHHA